MTWSAFLTEEVAIEPGRTRHRDFGPIEREL